MAEDTNIYYRRICLQLFHIGADQLPSNRSRFDDDNLMVGIVRTDRVCVVLWVDSVVFLMGTFDGRVERNDLVEYDVNDMCSLKTTKQRVTSNL